MSAEMKWDKGLVNVFDITIRLSSLWLLLLLVMKSHRNLAESISVYLK